MGPANNLNYLIQHLAAIIGRQSEQLLREQLGIGLSQYKILMVLEWNPRVQQRAIANSLGQTEASVSRQIKLLTAQGLLVSKPDPQNRRKHLTAPTPRGMQLTEAAGDLLRRHYTPEFNRLGDGQLTELTQGLQRLHALVCRPGQPSACDHPLGL